MKLQRRNGKLLRKAGKILRAEKCCCSDGEPPPPPPGQCYEITANTDSAAVAKFNNGANFLPGDYQVTYVSGALRYAEVEGFRINATSTLGGGSNYNIVDGSGDLKVAPATNTTEYDTQAEVEVANAGATVTFTHTGGTIGIKLYDDSYGDNATDSAAGDSESAPVFRLCPLYCPLCPNCTPSTIDVNIAGLVQCLCAVSLFTSYNTTGNLTGGYTLTKLPDSCQWQADTGVDENWYGDIRGHCGVGETSGEPSGTGDIYITCERVVINPLASPLTYGWLVIISGPRTIYFYGLIETENCSTGGTASNQLTAPVNSGCCDGTDGGTNCTELSGVGFSGAKAGYDGTAEITPGECATCPTNCDECFNGYTFTIDSNCVTTSPFLMSRVADECRWVSGSPSAELKCDSGAWVFTFDDADVCSCRYVWHAPITGHCPPTDPADWTFVEAQDLGASCDTSGSGCCGTPSITAISTSDPPP